MSVKETWRDLKAWYSDHLPEVLETLNPGASEQALNEFDEALRQEIGQGLPAELRELYLQNNGQSRDALCGMWFGLIFMRLEEVYEDWRMWSDIAKDNEAYIEFWDFGAIHPPEAIRRDYASAHYLPFVHDGGGNHIGVDLQPGPRGKVGQIINFGGDEHYRCVLAPSLNNFIAWLVNQYQKGNHRIISHKRREQQVRCTRLLDPPLEHFLDAVPALFGNKKGQPSG